MVEETLLYHVSLILLNSVTFVLNLLIVVIFIRYWKRFFQKGELTRRLRAERNHNMYLSSMVFADVLVGIFGTITGILLKSVQNTLIYKLCGLIPLYGCMFASVFSVMFLTIDRLLAIKYPLYYDFVMSNSFVTKSIALCWIVPVLTAVSQMIVYVSLGKTIELKIRNTLLTLICLTEFIILFPTNFMLIQTFKDQNKRFDALKKLSHQLVPADEGRSHDDIDEADTFAERPSHLGQHEPDHIDSVSDVCPAKEASRVSLSLESDRATGSNEDLFVFRKSVAFFSRRTSSFANSMQEVKRNTLSFPLATSYKALSTESQLTVLSSFNRLADSMTMSVDTHAYTMSFDTIDTDEVGINSENDVSANCQSLHTVRKKSLLSRLNRNISDRKITILCICIIIAELICWLPLVGYRFSYVVGRTSQIPWFRRLTQCLALFNSLLNPFMYFMVRKDLRYFLKKLLKIGNHSMTKVRT